MIRADWFVGVCRLSGGESRARRRLNGLLATAVAGFMLAGCGHGMYNDYDTAGGVKKKDYESLLGRKAPGPQAKAEEPPIPQLQSVLAAPSAPELADTRRVSIAVTETTPIRDVLIELARKAGVDLELDQRISGGIIMTANDRSFIDVIDRICDLADLRYTFEKNTLHVVVDDPYMEQYQMNVLNMTRNTSSSISSSTDAASAASAIGGGGGGGGNKSATSISSSSDADFWGTVSTNIKLILEGIKNRRPLHVEAMTAQYVPQAETAPAVPSTAPAGPGGRAGAALAQAQSLSSRQAQLDANLKQDQAADRSTEQQSKAEASETTGAGAANLGNSDFSINAQAGIITVFATQRQHKAIDRYLHNVLASVNQQVLIEAKILEVTLDDEYHAGINWTTLLGPHNGLGIGLPGSTSITTDFTRGVTTSTFPNPTLGIMGSNASNTLNYAAQLVSSFGTVRTLSNPRLTVSNNQTAVLKVASNQVFFQLQVTTTDSTPTTVGKTTVSSQIKTVPVGLVMTVQPAVDPVTHRISMQLRPSLTRITGFVQDPGVQLTIAQFNQTNPAIAQNISSPIPIIDARELDSVVSLDSGDTLVMGGLMQDMSNNTREGIPGAMDVPILGQAVSSNVKSNNVSELVIFLRATLVNDRDTVADEDIRLYKTFTPDPRPITF